MRYGIFSDIHSNLEALEAVIHAYKKEGIDRYFCLGDVVGYAADPAECAEKVRILSSVTIAGNHDYACVGLFSLDYFNPLAKEAIIWTNRNITEKEYNFLAGLKLTFKNKEFTLAHGTLDRPEEFNYMTGDLAASSSFESLDNNLCFVGHTHIPGIFVRSHKGEIRYQSKAEAVIKEGNKYIINTGSVGQPRDGDPKAAYCVYDTKKKTVKVKRVSYDAQAARKKIVDHGLPASLGERLLIGR